MISIEDLSFCPPSMDGKKTSFTLSGISLKIHPGEFVSIVGRNGAGKTTLIRHLNGILSPTRGRILINGMDTRLPENLSTIRRMVGMVFQQPEDQIIASTVEEDVAFGLENRGIPSSTIRNRVDQMLDRMGLLESRHRPPQFLSAGQIQRLALAGVLVLQPEYVVFDEVTAMLDPLGRKTVLNMMKDLHRQGVTVIYVTHAMEEAALSSRMIVLQNGQVVEDGPPANVLTSGPRLELYGLEQTPAALIARRLKPFFPELDRPILTLADLTSRLSDSNLPPTAVVPQKPALQKNRGSKMDVVVHHLDHIFLAGTPLAHQALRDANLSVPSSEPHGIIGATGSGKSTMLQHLNGIIRPQTGLVRSLEFNLNDPSLKTKTVVEKIGMVFQNPDYQFFKQLVGDEIAFGPRQYPLKEPIKERVRWAMETAGLDFSGFKDRLLSTLSGGEKRKVALASALAGRPSLLLLDEPTAGLDPRARRDLITCLRTLSLNGMTMVISSHRMEDLMAIVPALTVFSKGSTILTGTREEVFSDQSLLDKAGLEPPIATAIGSILQGKGWSIPNGLVTGTMLAHALSALTGISIESI